MWCGVDDGVSKVIRGKKGTKKKKKNEGKGKNFPIARFII